MPNRRIPKRLASAYNMEFFKDPVCLSGCSAYVVAELKPMLGDGSRKQIVIRLVPTLVIRADKKRQSYLFIDESAA